MTFASTSALEALGLLAGAAWMARRRPLPPAGDGADSADRAGRADRAQPPGSVSIVIPAHDEAAALPALLRSLHADALRPNGLVREVIVVDDGSGDGTAEVASAHGAVVLRLDAAPPAGWTGKAHACARGAARATGRVLLFLDADVTVGDDAVERLLAAHARHGGLISVQPRHRVVRPYEELSATCNVVAMLGTGVFAPWPARRPVAFGPCLMMGADDYAAVGGHAAVRGQVIDDVHLARRFAAHGLAVTAFAGDESLSFRMYPGGIGQLVDGWTKSLAAGAGVVDPIAVLVAVGWVAACLAVGVSGIRALTRAPSISSAEAVRLAASWAAVTLELRWMTRRAGTFRWATALLHPIPTGAFVALFARSAWLTVARRSVRWRGRQVAIGADRGP